MVTATAEDTKRETWRDPPWTLPDESPQFNHITREELIERVRALGFDVSARDLIFWESKGVLPRTIKTRHAGATRALYPHWMIYYVVTLRELQLYEGLSLETIAGELRRPFHRAISRAAYGSGLAPLEEGEQVFRPHRRGVAIAAELRRLSRSTGREFVRAEVRYIPRNGEPVEERFTLHGLEDSELQ